MFTGKQVPHSEHTEVETFLKEINCSDNLSGCEEGNVKSGQRVTDDSHGT